MDTTTFSRSVDLRGCEITGASPAALQAFERALAAFQRWRSGGEAPLAAALEDSPRFVMAHVLQAYQYLATRDPASGRAARPILERASRLAANARERMHLAVVATVLDDDYERAKAMLGEILRREPRDALALQVAHSFDYLTGDLARLGDRAARVLPAWSSDMPGYPAVLAMHAFGLVETGDCVRAEWYAREALALDPLDARAHHVLAHVFEMTERFDEGIGWMTRHAGQWSVDTVVATHCWWHLALFHLALGHVEEALALYDARVRPHRSNHLGDMIDASALLWRIDLAGRDPGARWRELALAWSPRIGDGFCTFSDLHAMLAFVGARDWNLALRMVRELAQRQEMRTRHGETTRRIGLPAAQALVAFRRNEFERATGLLAKLSAEMPRIGGSHAQRDVLHLTLLHALGQCRRSAPAAREASRVATGITKSWRERIAFARLQATHPRAA